MSIVVFSSFSSEVDQYVPSAHDEEGTLWVIAQHVCGSPDPGTVSFSDHTRTQTYTCMSREDVIFLIVSKYLLPIYIFIR